MMTQEMAARYAELTAALGALMVEAYGEEAGSDDNVAILTDDIIVAINDNI